MNLRIDNLTKSYAGETVLSGCNGEFEEGSFTAVIGRSGCGKTTLVKLLAGLEKPDGGTIFLDQRSMEELSEDQLDRWRLFHVGAILQEMPLLEELTVLENMQILARIQKEDIEEDYQKQLTDRLGLGDMLNKKPGTLSPGQKQRVCAARALLTKPDLILADEPTEHLDSVSANEILRLLKECQSLYGQTVILMTHDLNLAKQADTLCYMEDGKLYGYARE